MECPYCGNIIKSGAQKCIFCGRWLEKLSFSEKILAYRKAKHPAHIEANCIGWGIIIIIVGIFYFLVYDFILVLFHSSTIIKYIAYVVLIPFLGIAVIIQNKVERKLVRYHYYKIIHKLKN